MPTSLETHEISPSAPLSPAAFHDILAKSSGPIAFRGHNAAAPAQASPDRHDVTVIITDPNANQRGSADLLARLWQTFPRIAALVDKGATSFGAIVFSSDARQEAAKTGAASPRMALSQAIARGASLHAIVDAGTTENSPEEPPLLTPTPLDKQRQRWSGIIENIPRRALVDNITSKSDAQAILAGLLLWHDDLDASHVISQSIEGDGRHAAGDYWHAIMHRREPDYKNCKYWFRRTGAHPIHAELAERAVMYLNGTPWEHVANDGEWNPAGFVDACREAERNGDFEGIIALRRCQADEMLLLLEQTCRDATD